MTEQTVKIKYESDVSGVKKAEAAEKAYSKQLTQTEQRVKALRSLFKGRQAALRQQAQATQEATQATRDATQATQEQTLITQQATDKINEASEQIRRYTAFNENLNQKIEKLGDAQEKATRTTSRNTEAWLRNARTILFWTIGAASVFRLVQKIKRALLDTVKELTKNSQEYKRLEAAQNSLKASIVTVVGGHEDWLKIIGAVATGIDRLSKFVVLGTASIKGFGAGVQQVFDNINRASLESALERIERRGELVAGAEANIRAELAKLNPEMSAGDAIFQEYMNTVAEFIDTEERLITANEKTSRSLDEQKNKVDALSDREKALDSSRDKLADAQRRRLEALADLETERLRRLEDINLETQRALADVDLKGSRKREDIEIKFRRAMENLQRRVAEQRARIEERLRLKLLRIELRFREQMIRIQENFDDSIFDAISKRDATAALLAIRRRSRDEGRARRERANAILLANEEAKIQRNQQARNLEMRRQDALLARQRALEDLARDLAREREDIATNQQRELEDLATFLSRRQSDIERDYQRQAARAKEFYRQANADYQEFLDTQLGKLQSHITRVNSLITQNPSVVTSGTVPSIGSKPPEFGMADGGDMTFRRPTTIAVAEKGPERVIAQPVSATSGGNFSGSMSHQVTGSISAAMDGFEGRMAPIITDAVVRVMGEMLN